MKKKKNEKVKRRRTVSDENAALNKELGSFGLEPPKRYRNEQSSFDVPQYNDRMYGERAVHPPRTRGEAYDTSRSKKRTSSKDRQLREDNRRKKSKLKRKVIFYATLTLAIIAFIVVMCLTVLFKINTISIKGNQVYTNKEITAVLPIEKGKNLFLADTKGAEQKLCDNLPYIYHVSVKRKLPSTVIVTITETPKVYYVKTAENNYTFLDSNFKVLDTGVGNLPEGGIEIKDVILTSSIVGSTAEFKNAKTRDCIQKMAQAAEKLNLDKITSIYSKDINNNYMVYDGRITFKLGNNDKLEDKLYSALTATKRLEESNPSAKGTMTATNDKQIYFTEDK